MRPSLVCTIAVTLLLAAWQGGVSTQETRPSAAALEAMANAERAFARMALEKGIRDAFVEFFAEDSVGFYPKPTNARRFYGNQPPTPLTRKLEWEPRLGDVAASGELGWLTGPYASSDTASGAPPRHGCYFSIWVKRRVDATGSSPCDTDARECVWKVMMDVGVGTPSPVTFEQAGFRPVAEPFGRYSPPAAEAARKDRSMLATERQFAETAREDPAAAYRAIASGVSRLHVPGRQPMTGGDAIAAFAAESKQPLSNTLQTSALAKSGDLGYAFGSYAQRGADTQGAAVEEGYYVRTWKRGADGKWTLAVEVRSPLPKK